MHPRSLARRGRLVAVDVNPAEYLSVNRSNWDSRVPHHVRGYDLTPFRTDPTHISDVVRFDLPLLGEVAGLSGVHLQCHIGSDTVSLARLGARMTGLDFSAPALLAAADLAAAAATDVEWVESDVYRSAEVLGEGRFDFVYTGIGALCWIPDASLWAANVAALLRPGGFLFIREGHPMLWTLCDPRDDQMLLIEYPYFESAGTVFEEPYTYVEHEAPLHSPAIVHFNHSLSEIFNALWSAGMTITLFEEHPTVPWNAAGDAMESMEGGEFRLREKPERLAASYTLRAEKR